MVEFMAMEKPPSAMSNIFELLFILMITALGVILNYRYRKKLLEEKRSVPFNRRGNVIEPVMSWFCILQIIFWPHELLLFWSLSNQIISSDDISNWTCNILFMAVISGRMCIAYNSLFVALIRYVHIVHHKISNQWSYKNAAKWFKLAGIIIPLAMEVLGLLTHGITGYNDTEEIQECLASSSVSNSSINNYHRVPSDVPHWTMQYLPVSLVNALSYVYVTITAIVLINITEAILYLLVFRKIKR